MKIHRDRRFTSWSSGATIMPLTEQGESVMSKPQTLLQLSGRSYAPATLANATLLVIDVQEEYRSGAMALPNLAPALEEITRLLALARAAGSPIVHVHHLGIMGGLFDPQGLRGQIMPEATPLPG